MVDVAHNNGKKLKPGHGYVPKAREKDGKFKKNMPWWFDDYVRILIQLGPKANIRTVVKAMNGLIEEQDVWNQRRSPLFRAMIKEAVEDAIGASTWEPLWYLKEIYENEEHKPTIRIAAIRELRGWVYDEKKYRGDTVDRGLKAVKEGSLDKMLNMLQGKIEEVKVRDTAPLEYGPVIEYDPDSESTEYIEAKPLKTVIKDIQEAEACESSKQSTG